MGATRPLTHINTRPLHTATQALLRPRSDYKHVMRSLERAHSNDVELARRKNAMQVHNEATSLSHEYI